ncbi:hypothetical protein GXW78_05745 [Roseomonas terrae]|uniref:Uncharacterized protein n=1 Tax=Neoroseomonas terrae TaxID=424799 RepID=A0ABS5EDQ8_9PROT|nr:hypothetical protein [Neoroseomonas terrae]MBR0649156.1 hypothetical protein [Neoroseomonas terrae]
MPVSEHDEERTDKSAILMMLAYVEAECRRLGVTEAADHAAQAATILSPAGPGAAPRRSGAAVFMPLLPLH